MFKRVGKIVLALIVLGLLVAGTFGVGGWAYRAGYVNGLAQADGDADAPNGPSWFAGRGAWGGPSMMRPGPFMMGGYHPFGVIGRLVGCLFFLGLVFIALRLLLGPRHWGWGWRAHAPGGPGAGLPPFFEEWHRRAHGQTPPPPEPPPAA